MFFFRFLILDLQFDYNPLAKLRFGQKGGVANLAGLPKNLTTEYTEITEKNL